MSVAVALFTADLRVHDNPVLRGALDAADQVAPLFVLDDGIRAAGFLTPNRAAFLAGCLADLDGALRERGGRLVLRGGDLVREVCRVADDVAAGEVNVARGFARRREERLNSALSQARRVLRVHEAAVAAVPPGAVTPSGRGHFAVFGAYFRRWRASGVRPPLDPPGRVPVPRVPSEPLPGGLRPAMGRRLPGLPQGGEREARRRMAAWLAGPIEFRRARRAR